MPLLILNLSCENVKYPARKHFEKTNIVEQDIFSSDSYNAQMTMQFWMNA